MWVSVLWRWLWTNYIDFRYKSSAVFCFLLSHSLALCLKMQQQRDMEIIIVKILACPWAEITAEHRGQAVSQLLLNLISLIPQKSPLRSGWCYRRAGDLRERWGIAGHGAQCRQCFTPGPSASFCLRPCGEALPTWKCHATHPPLGSLLWNRNFFLSEQWTIPRRTLKKHLP